MNDLGLLLIGGAARATALAAVGAVLAVLLRRRGPSAVALAAVTTLSGLVVVSALSLSPWPRFWTLDLAGRAAPAAAARGDQAAPVADAPTAGRAVAGPAAAPAAETFAELARTFARELRSQRLPPAPAARAAWRWPAWVGAGLLAASALAAARLALAVRAVAALRRRSRRLADASLCEEVDVLRAEIGCVRGVEVRETDDLATPATVGWLRPVVLLPADWRTWDAPERRAVLAHELAHVRRGDYLWGFWAQVCLAVHPYHPLAHWLTARLRLEQELAADAWGARLSGGNRPYLEALARLALRRGGPLESSPSLTAWPARPFLPTRGTFLRRIEMLRDAKSNPLPTAPLPPLGRAATVAALAAAGLFVAGLRGPVSDALAGQNPPPKKAEAAGKLPLGEVDIQGVERRIFSIDLTRAPRETSLVIVGRPAEVFKSPAFRQVAGMVNAAPWFGGSLGVKVEEIEAFALYVVRQPVVAGKGPAITQVVTLVTSTPEAAKAIVAKVVPDPAEVTFQGHTYARSKADPGRVAATSGDRTVILGPENALRLVLAARGGPGVQHAWSDAWSKVNKGQLAVAADTAFLASFITPAVPGEPPPGGRAIQAMMTTVRPLLDKAVAYAAGLDLKGGLAADLVAHGSSEQGARQVAETLEALRILGKNTLADNRRPGAGAAPGDREPLSRYMGLVEPLLANAKEQKNDDPRFVEYRSRTDGDVAGVAQAMLPAVTAARAAAYRAQSVNNMKYIGLAMHNYANTDGRFPPAVGYKPGSKVPFSWRVAILPYLDQQNELYKQYDFNEPWDGPNNRKLLDRMPQVYARPGDQPDTRHAAYFVLTGPDTAFPPDGPGVKLVDITDGTSNTIMTVEAKRDIPWTKPEDIPYDAAKPVPELGGFNPDGFNVGFCDGPVRHMSNRVNEAVLRALMTRSGGEVISVNALGTNLPPTPQSTSAKPNR